MPHDLRAALRAIRRHRGLSAVVMLTMALAIGASTAIFSIADGLLYRPLPVKNPNGLLLLQWEASAWPKATGAIYTYGDCDIPYDVRDFRGCTFSPAFLHVLQARAHTLAGVTGFGKPGLSVLATGAQALPVQDEQVAGNFFNVLGLHPALGRLFSPSDDRTGAPAAMVLSYEFWRLHFAADRSIIGRTVEFGRKPVTIIGVAPPGFAGLTPGAKLDAWIPLSLGRALDSGWTPAEDQLGSHWLVLVARARPGVSAAAVQAEVSGLFSNLLLHASRPLATPADHPRVVMLHAQLALAGLRTRLRQPLTVLLWLVAAVLLIACANIAGLLTARVESRGRELALRRVLGASAGRILRQLLTESLLLAFAGGVLGLGLAWLGNRALLALVLHGMPYYRLQAPLDGRVLLFALAATVGAGMLAGLVPAFKGGTVDQTRQFTARGTAFGKGLVVAQVAVCIVVLAGAGLFVRTLVNLRSINPGFKTGNLLLFTLDPSLAGDRGPRVLGVFEAVQRRIAALPGVEHASYAQSALLSGSWSKNLVRFSSRRGSRNTPVYAEHVGRGYFATMGIPLLRGRDFRSSDFEPEAAPGTAPPGEPLPHPVIVNRLLAQEFLKPGNAVGSLIGFDPAGEHPRYVVVGVVGDARYAQLRQPPQPMLYLPDRAYATFVVRTATAPMALLPAVRRIVHEVAPGVPVLDPTTENQTVNQLLFRERMLAHLASLFGAISLFLAALGLYALLAQEVTRRTREIGIRMALGAERRRVIRTVMARGAALALAGIVVGIVGAVAATRSLQSMLYGVSASDPVTLILVAVVLFGVALLACWIPARRASRVDPMVALRYE